MLEAGDRAYKIASKSDDTHVNGALCTVVQRVPTEGAAVGYFVHWDDLPGIPVFIAPQRLEKVVMPE